MNIGREEQLPRVLKNYRLRAIIRNGTTQGLARGVKILQLAALFRGFKRKLFGQGGAAEILAENKPLVIRLLKDSPLS